MAQSGGSGSAAGSAAEAEGAAARPGALLVLGDSLCHYGPKGGLPADDPRIWPNLVAAELGLRPELFARIGWTSRDAWWALIGDPRIWAQIRHVECVVVAVSGMDSLPSPLPTPLRETIRYLRPNALRRRVRQGYNLLQPRLSRLGWPMAVPPAVTVEYLEKLRAAIVAVRPEVPVLFMLPPTHVAASYGNVHPGRLRTTAAMREWAGQNAVPLVDTYAAMRDFLRAPGANPDGIHWSFAAHAAVAEAVLVEAVRAGERGAGQRLADQRAAVTATDRPGPAAEGQR